MLSGVQKQGTLGSSVSGTRIYCSCVELPGLKNYNLHLPCQFFFGIAQSRKRAMLCSINTVECNIPHLFVCIPSFVYALFIYTIDLLLKFFCCQNISLCWCVCVIFLLPCSIDEPRIENYPTRRKLCQSIQRRNEKGDFQAHFY